MKSLKVAFLFILCSLFFACPVFAKTFVMYELKAEGIDETTSGLVTGLLRSELSRVNQGDVRMVETERCYETACAREALARHKADAVIVGTIVKIGKSHTITMDVVWKKDTFHYKMILAEIEEINRLASRLAEAIVFKKSFDEAVSTKTVSKLEEETYRRVKGDFSWGPSLGFIAPIGGSYGGANMLYTIDLVFRYEIARLGFEFETGIYFNDQGSDDASAREWPLDFSMLYYFMDSDHSPFVGGSFGLHFIGVTTDLDEENEEDYGSWTPSVAGYFGYEMLRTHTFHFAVRAGYRGGFAALDGPGAHGAFLALAMAF